MKKRLLAALLMLTMVVAVFASCGIGGTKLLGKKNTAIGDLFNPEFTTAPASKLFTSVEDFELGDDQQLSLIHGIRENIIVIYDTSNSEKPKRILRNIETGKDILTFSADDDYSINKYGIIHEYETDASTDDDPKYACDLYDFDGNKYLSIPADKYDSFDTDYDYMTGRITIFTEDTIYIVRDMKVLKQYNIGEFINPDNYEFNVNYAIQKLDFALLIYDESLREIARFDIPTNAADFNYFILQNGNILLSYVAEVQDKGDVVVDGVSYSITNAILNVEKNTVKNLKGPKVVIKQVNAADDFQYILDTKLYAEDIENLVEYYPIIDGTVSEAREMVAMTNDGKFTYRLSDFTDGVEEYAPSPIKNGLYYIYVDNRTLIVDEELETKLELDGTIIINGYEFGFMFNYNDTKYVYDYNCQKLLELESGEYEVNFTTNTSFAYTKYDEDDDEKYTVYLLNSNGITPIFDEEDENVYIASIEMGLYYFRESIYETNDYDYEIFSHYAYTIYNSDGTVLKAINSSSSIEFGGDEYIIATYYDMTENEVKMLLLK